MTDQAISPLRRRMIEDMAIRKLAPKTQHDYVQRVKDFAAFLGRSPDTAKSEEVRGFRLHLASSGAGTPKINATVSALRFFFNVTLDRPDLAKHLSFTREPRKVPAEEVARFLEAAPSIKYKAALSVAYGAGLRVSEVVSLKVSHRDVPALRLAALPAGRIHRRDQDRHIMIAVVHLKLKNQRVTFAGPRPPMNCLAPVPRECRLLVSIATARHRFCLSQPADQVRRHLDHSPNNFSTLLGKTPPAPKSP